MIKLKKDINILNSIIKKNKIKNFNISYDGFSIIVEINNIVIITNGKKTVYYSIVKDGYIKNIVKFDTYQELKEYNKKNFII